MTWAGTRRERPGEGPGRPATSGAGAPPPDEALHSYIRAFSGCGAEAASFLWQSDLAGWFSIRLQSTPGGQVRVAADQVALPHRLTSRELDVLTLMAIGLSNTEIGRVLVASPRTVSTHVEHILAKLGQPSRTGAAALAVERGYLRLPLPGRAEARGSLAICRLHERVTGGLADTVDDKAAPRAWPGPPRPARGGRGAVATDRVGVPARGPGRR